MKCWNRECGNELSPQAVSCPACGTERPSKPAGKAFDPHWWQCADVDQFGQRCAKAGAISHGTLGNGPWYCQQHAFPQHKPTAPPKGFKALKQLVGLFPSRQPGEDDT